jgi:acetolactate synthase-1/2/3 large subunit
MEDRVNDQTSGGHLLAAALVAQGVRTVFSLCGNHTLAIYRGLIDFGVEIVDTRTEAGAVMAADAHARVTRQPAVAIVTGGPGLTNALTGLLTAHSIGSPVVLISGQNELALMGRGAQQELDQVATTSPLCKWSRMIVDVDSIPAMVDEAFRTAMSGSTGAVHLSVPVDIARATPSKSVRPVVRSVLQPGSRPVDGFIEDVLSRLTAARRPVVIAGTGAYMATADDALTRLADAGLPVFTIDLARGMLPDSHPRAMGYADPALNAAAERIVDADVVLLLGKWLDFRLRWGATSFIAEDAVLIEIGPDAAVLGRNRTPTLAAECDVAGFAAALADKASGQTWDTTAWCAELTALIGPPGGEENAAVEGPGLHPLEVARTLAGALPENASIVLDAGDFVQWCRSVLPANGPGRWLRVGPMSTCGAGTPLALGLKKARPDDVVVLIVGDGSFGYHLAEIEAARRQGLPFVVVLGNNDAWGLECHLQRGLYGDDYVVASELSSVRYDQVVTALGGYGERVTTLEEIPAAFERAVASGLPACLDIPIGWAPSPLTRAVIGRGGEV